jgi:pimeloyl-ACP methyl ester carboxylesterase
VVLAWHLQDPPRSETAFAAAVPLAGLDAWRIYLGLPLNGSRLPDGGWEEIVRLGSEDAVRNVHDPVVHGAIEELEPAWAALRDQLRLDVEGPTGVMGGSIGAAIAQLVLAEHVLDVAAAVLISPVIQLRAAVETVGRSYGITYPWDDDTSAFAAELDFVARAAEVVARHPRLATLAVVGEDDDKAGFLTTSAELVAAHGDGRAELVTIPGMAHAFAEEPGLEAAPQTPQGAAVDREAVRWFGRHLGTSG